ncbi:hypothetical protein L6164_020930 [Bauhinia variegata]|uniref:Uncharacterized protein n=1 Tax=Bauhinia variegata TaxID=167791 RepID=A0ACB9MXE4_BAUVA|nr:hypothetical protein L6164_020930 [Bauhinia variegata]
MAVTIKAHNSPLGPKLSIELNISSLPLVFSPFTVVRLEPPQFVGEGKRGRNGRRGQNRQDGLTNQFTANQ